MKKIYEKPSIEAIDIQPVSLMEGTNMGKGSETLSSEDIGKIQSTRGDFECVDE